MVRVHGSSVAVEGRGILLRGPSGSGKSDLALRLIDEGAMLVADDQTELRRAGNGIEMTSPATIAGRMEVRGVGIVDMPHLPLAPLCLVVDLAPNDAVERLPEPRFCSFEGVAIPAIVLDAFAASAPAKLKLALKCAASCGAGPRHE